MKDCVNCKNEVGDLRPACPYCGGKEFAWPEPGSSRPQPQEAEQPSVIAERAVASGARLDNSMKDASETINGVEYRVVKSHMRLVKTVMEDGRGLFWCKSTQYGPVVSKLTANLRGGRYSAIADAVIAAPIFCAGCRGEFPRPHMLALRTMAAASHMPDVAAGVRCPSCNSDECYLQVVDHSGESITQADVESLRGYWRSQAQQWWPRQEEDVISCWYGQLTCKPIQRGEGYLIGPGELKCEACIDRSLENGVQKLRENPDRFGEGILAKIREFRLKTE